MKDKIQDEHQAITFLNSLYQNCDKKYFINLRLLDSEKKLPPINRFISLNEINSIPKILKTYPKRDAYFAVATREKGKGKKENIGQFPCLFLDVDFKDISEKEVLNRLKEFSLRASFIIYSGHGMHIYWLLKEPPSKAETNQVEILNKKLAAFFHGDISSTEAARILRIPGTLNFKDPSSPKEIVLKNFNPENQFNLSSFDFLLQGDEDQEKQERSYSQEMNEQLNRIMECDFIKYCDQNRKTLSEPQWHGMISILARETGGRQLIHNLSKGYPKYSPEETNKKILHAMDAGPISCQWIKKELWKCPKNCRVKSPAALAFKDEHEKQNQVNELLSLTDDLILFHDQYRDGYAFLNKECISLRSKQIKIYLSKLMWDNHGKSPSTEILNQTLNVLEAQARFDNSQITLFNRVGKISDGDESFYYDLTNGKAVKISPNGWDICDSPILFRRFSHQKEQVTPIKGEDPWILFKHLNVKLENQLLVLVYIISCFIPNIPHPVFYPHGDHGSGKTTCSKIIKDIVDPSQIPTLSLQDEKKELPQQLNHHWMPFFDNVSSLSPYASDLFSQICTGGGFSKRQLYTDEDDVIYSIKRCTGLNGINVSIYKPDLLDRTILLPFERIENNQRKEEIELLAEFEKDKPLILGGIFDTLSKAININPATRLPRIPRMADFARWGFSIAEVLFPGDGGKKFLESYQQNIHLQNEEVIQSSTLAQSILTFMDDKKDWNGTMGGLYEKLDEIAGRRDKNDRSFPKASRTLHKHLKIIKPNLADVGIVYKIWKRTKDGYPISLLKTVEEFRSFGSPDTSFDENMH